MKTAPLAKALEVLFKEEKQKVFQLRLCLGLATTRDLGWEVFLIERSAVKL